VNTISFRYEDQPVPMTIKDFAILMENNNATDRKEYFIERVYNPDKTTAFDKLSS
jgi:hypothetical protein